MRTLKPGLLCCGCLEGMANVSWMPWHVEVRSHQSSALFMTIVRICQDLSVSPGQSLISSDFGQFVSYGETWRNRFHFLLVSLGRRWGTVVVSSGFFPLFLLGFMISLGFTKWYCISPATRWPQRHLQSGRSSSASTSATALVTSPKTSAERCAQ